MGEALLTYLCMENHHPSTLLSMDSGLSLHDAMEREMNGTVILSRPPDINLPLSAEPSPPPQLWVDTCEVLDVGLPQQTYEAETIINLPKVGRKCAKRFDSIWGAWVFFSFYFKPVLNEKSKCKLTRDSNGVCGYDKSDLRLDSFMVQHDLENIYMWMFKERPENALGKMQLRSYMNGHSRQGERPFPFSVDRGFVRSHRMQRKHYRGLSNPQCVHGIEIVRSPDLVALDEEEQKKWIELTGRDINFSVPLEASDFGSWRNLPNTEFDLERLTSLPKTNNNLHPKVMLNGSGLNLSTQTSNQVNVNGSSNNNGNVNGMDLLPICNKRRKEVCSHGHDDDCCLPNTWHIDRLVDIEVHPVKTPWLNDFSGVMQNVYGPVTGAKTIYEDDEGFLIIVSLPFADMEKVKVTWRNTLTNGIVKISCVSTACKPLIKRQERTFKLTDPSPEHCPPGDFIREITLATRIPDGAKLEAYRDETGTVLEIHVPKPRVGPEEHEVRVCLRPSTGLNDHMLI